MKVEKNREGPKTVKKKKKLCGAGWPASPRAYTVRTRASILGAHLLCGPARSSPFKNSPSRTGLNGPGWPVYPLLHITVADWPAPPRLRLDQRKDGAGRGRLARLSSLIKIVNVSLFNWFKFNSFKWFDIYFFNIKSDLLTKIYFLIEIIHLNFYLKIKKIKVIFLMIKKKETYEP